MFYTPCYKYVKNYTNKKIMDEEQKKSEEMFILMKIGKMTVTEINTLTDKERFFLSKWFMEAAKNEEQMYKDKLKNS